MSRKLVLMLSVSMSLLLVVIVLFLGVQSTTTPEPSTPSSIHIVRDKNIEMMEQNKLFYEDYKAYNENEQSYSSYWVWKLKKESKDLVIKYAFEHQNVKNDEVIITKGGNSKYITTQINNEKKEIIIKIIDTTLITSWDPQILEYSLVANPLVKIRIKVNAVLS